MAADDLGPFLAGYVECALWGPDVSRAHSGSALCDNYGPEDIHPDSLATMRRDCEEFACDNAADLHGSDPELAGQDFWLTRNRHGVGWCWVRGPRYERLCDAAEDYGETETVLYVGTDGLLHLEKENT